MYVEVKYWEPSADGKGGQYATELCFITAEEILLLRQHEPPAFIEVTVNDGDTQYIPVDLISKVMWRKESN